MNGPTAERFCVFALRLLALSFFVVGILFIAAPDSVLSSLADQGEWFSDGFAEPPGTGAKLWLGLAFAYMMVITAICLVAQADVVRYRPLLLVLAVGKAASSLSALAFFAFDENVYAYLLNFVVDGLLVGAALWLWVLAGRVGRPPAPS